MMPNTSEQEAPKHPASFFAGDERMDGDEKG